MTLKKALIIVNILIITIISLTLIYALYTQKRARLTTNSKAAQPINNKGGALPRREERPSYPPTNSGGKLSGQYIVTLKKSTERKKSGAGGKILTVQQFADYAVLGRRENLIYVYDRAIEGFAAKLLPQRAAQLRADPDVASVDQDQIVYLGERDLAESWGLDRIDQIEPIKGGSLGNIALGYYEYPPTGGRGVHVYVIDSGVRTSHAEFTGRLGSGYFNTGNSVEDCNGHGTHVAGIVGGRRFGVAKNVTIHPVRIFGCESSASWSKVIDAINWVIGNAAYPAIINMSLGGTRFEPVDRAVSSATNSGITVVISAMNEGQSVDLWSPARVREAITVGSTTEWDMVNTWSNFGPGVDIHAPGYRIVSASHTADNGFVSKNGTSMAAPHVSGVAALYLSTHTTAPPAEVATFVTSAATANVLTNVQGGSPNKLLNMSSLVTCPQGRSIALQFGAGTIRSMPRWYPSVSQDPSTLPLLSSQNTLSSRVIVFSPGARDSVSEGKNITLNINRFPIEIRYAHMENGGFVWGPWTSWNASSLNPREESIGGNYAVFPGLWKAEVRMVNDPTCQIAGSEFMVQDSGGGGMTPN